MTEFNDASQHTPTPEFRASLKRELRRAYRAEQQFDVPRTRGKRLGMMIGLAAGGVFTLTVGLVLGAATGYASAENLNARRREATVNAVNAVTSRRQFATMRLDLARANYDAVRRDFEAGRATADAVRSAKAEVDTMEAKVSRVETDLEARVEAGAPASPAPSSGLSLLKGPMRNAITALTCGAAATAAQAAPAQQGVPIVTVTPAVARTTTTLGAVLGVRELPDGKLLVNDAGRRQIKVFDPTLANATVALDSAAGTSNSYGPQRAEIFPFHGDSTALAEIFQDVLVLDRTGHVARALASPQFGDGITPFPVGFPTPKAMDHRGRLLSQGGVSVRNGAMADSSLIYRADLDTRQVDVVGAVHLGSRGERNRNEPPEDGKRVVTTIRQPVPTEDAWAVLSDGTIAFVRGQDYHVDWINPDGTKSATTKLPFDWKRLSDEDKQKLADSAKVAWDSMMVIRNARNAGPAQPARGEGGGDSPGRGRSGGGVGEPGSSQGGSIQRMVSVPLSDIPDYYPPIRRNSAMADLDGNLWILPTTSAQSQRGELVYDVVNPKKGLFQRVRMPVGRSIAGFGKGGVLYLQSGDMTNGFHLERVKLDVAKPQH